jgi:hypothetical protein
MINEGRGISELNKEETENIIKDVIEYSTEYPFDEKTILDYYDYLRENLNDTKDYSLYIKKSEDF